MILTVRRVLDTVLINISQANLKHIIINGISNIRTCLSNYDLKYKSLDLSNAFK